MSRSRFTGIVNQFADFAEQVKRGRATGADPEATEWLELVKRRSPEQMAALAAGRLAGSPPERSDWAAFSSHLAADFALSPAKLRAVTDLVDEVLSSLGTDRDPGQVIHWAVAADEPPGKPLTACRLVPVRLTYWDPSDEPDPASNRGSNRVQDLKVARIQRFCQEAKEAGGYLTYADLSYLLGIHTAALSRMVRDHSPEPVPLRGSECDIGRGITHRARVIELYLQMHTETEIVSRTGHSYESIESYIKDFARVLVLSERGLTPTMIRRVTGRSMALVRAYLDLVEQHSTPDHAFRFHQLRKVFYRQEEAAGVKKSSRSDDP